MATFGKTLWNDIRDHHDSLKHLGVDFEKGAGGTKGEKLRRVYIEKIKEYNKLAKAHNDIQAQKGAKGDFIKLLDPKTFKPNQRQYEESSYE